MHASLGIEIVRSSERFVQDILELGLASEEEIPGWRSLVGPLPFRARVLPRGVRRSAWVVSSHWAKGQTRWATAVLMSLVVGLATRLHSLVALAAGGLLFALAVLVHEAGHVVAYRALAPRDAPAIFVVRGMRCHLVRMRLMPLSDVAVALAGPLAPGGMAIFFVPLLFAERVAPWMPLVCVAWLALALSHALCAALPLGDGATIRESWRLARTERSSRRSSTT